MILAQTIKGYGLGEAGEGKNITHSQKKLNEDELKEFRTRFNIPVSDDDISAAPFYKPDEDSPEMEYLRQRRQELGGSLPARMNSSQPMACQTEETFKEYYEGSGDRPLATTMAYVHLLSKLLRDPEFGKLIVPIVPDEARTFGMESLFRQGGYLQPCGSAVRARGQGQPAVLQRDQAGRHPGRGAERGGQHGQLHRRRDGLRQQRRQHHPPSTPSTACSASRRVGDLIWQACDSRARGFLIGATAGRTTLAGEGLQHQDGHSHVLAMTPTKVKAYDPAFAYELAVIIHDGITRMYCHGEDWIYYLTVTNETYLMPPCPGGPTCGKASSRACTASAAPA